MDGYIFSDLVDLEHLNHFDPRTHHNLVPDICQMQYFCCGCVKGVFSSVLQCILEAGKCFFALSPSTFYSKVIHLILYK
jgi:hypothetical protein